MFNLDRDDLKLSWKGTYKGSFIDRWLIAITLSDTIQLYYDISVAEQACLESSSWSGFPEVAFN